MPNYLFLSQEADLDCGALATIRYAKVYDAVQNPNIIQWCYSTASTGGSYSFPGDGSFSVSGSGVETCSITAQGIVFADRKISINGSATGTGSVLGCYLDPPSSSSTSGPWSPPSPTYQTFHCLDCSVVNNKYSDWVNWPDPYTEGTIVSNPLDLEGSAGDPIIVEKFCFGIVTLSAGYSGFDGTDCDPDATGTCSGSLSGSVTVT
jgi:hypothetical protein